MNAHEDFDDDLKFWGQFWPLLEFNKDVKNTKSPTIQLAKL